MGKFLAGMLLVLLVPIGFVSNAGAAEIPPTKECSKLFKKLMPEYFDAIGSDGSDAAIKKADRKLAISLADADCISDADALYKNLAPKPFSKKCKVAARAANDFWKARSRRLNTAFKKHERLDNRISARIQRVDNRINRLRVRGASAKRLKPLRRLRAHLVRTSARREKTLLKRLDRLVSPVAYDTTLIIFEMGSLRCFASENLLDDENAPVGPAAKAISKNALLVLFSVFYVAFEGEDFGASASSAARSLPLDLGQAELADLRLPLIHKP